VNVFEGVVWYNKERFEEVLRYAGAIAAIESDEALFGAGPKAVPGESGGLNAAAWHKRLGAIAETVSELRRAHEASGYQAEALIAALDAPRPAPGRGRGQSLS
jgi:hypothetical protein